MSGGAWADLVRWLEIDRLGDAELLLWLVPLALLPLAAVRLLPPRALPWPALREARRAGARTGDVPRWLGAALRVLALVALALALARPLGVRELPPESGLGLDLVLVLDASGSMAALDTAARRSGVPEARTSPRAGGTAPGAFPASARSRLDLAREAVARFASRRVGEGDRVGLVVFGESAFTQSPLTHDGGLLRAALERVHVGVAGDSTALGDALALAVKRVSGAGAADRRVVVLLTDGRSNTGEIPVAVATELAVASGVRVHTVAIGTHEGEVAVADDEGLRYERHEPDPETLRWIADTTGGRFLEAVSSTDLLLVYDTIDRLERAPRPLPPRVVERERPEPLLAAAGSLLLLELLSLRSRRRALP